METSNRVKQPSNDKLIFLKQEQQQYSEGTSNWIKLQTRIDHIIAQNYLEYLNR